MGQDGIVGRALGDIVTRKGFLVPALVIALVSSIGGLSVANRGGLSVPTRRALPMAQMESIYGNSFDLPAPPAGQSPEQRAHWLLEQRPALGRTPTDWARSANATRALDLTGIDPARPIARPDLTANVLRVYASLGLSAPPSVRAQIASAAARIPAFARAPFADVVGVVADAYATQLPLARAVAARLAAGFDPHTPALSAVDRDAMIATQNRILGAINLFRAHTQAGFDVAALKVPHLTASGGTDPPLFSDPEGVIILGGVGNGTYTRSGLLPDPVLLIEPNGNDLYLNSAGGACPVTVNGLVFGGKWMQCNSLVLSVVADLGTGVSTSSDDSYSYDGEPAAVQGAGGLGALGMLIDVGGNDSYYAKMTRGTTNFWGPEYYFDGGAQGYGYAGAGLLLDGVGNDIYKFDVNSTAGRSIWALGQGFGGAGGIGVSSDGAGTDQWLSDGLGLTGGGFEGLYTDGVGFYGGIGVMTDTGLGNDIYRAVDVAQTTDFYAQGFGAFGGVGILYEDGGNDNYYTSQRASDPWINPLLNCAFGTASYGGVGIMVDLGGNDVYYGESVSNKKAEVMDSGFGGPAVGYGLFLDGAGTDRYTMVVTGTAGSMIMGRGLYQPLLGNTWGTFVDLGGSTDIYTGGPGGDNSQWAFGVDR